MKIIKKIGVVALLAVASTLTFFDINNHLNVGPVDQDGFTPLNHGIFGNLVKVLLVIISVSLLIYLLRIITGSTKWTILLVVILIPAIVYGAFWLSFVLWWTF